MAPPGPAGAGSTLSVGGALRTAYGQRRWEGTVANRGINLSIDFIDWSGDLPGVQEGRGVTFCMLTGPKLVHDPFAWLAPGSPKSTPLLVRRTGRTPLWPASRKDGLASQPPH